MVFGTLLSKFLNLDWWFRAGNSDTCIAEILADYQYRHYLFLI
jgi:hypothetical protein